MQLVEVDAVASQTTQAIFCAGEDAIGRKVLGAALSYTADFGGDEEIAAVAYCLAQNLFTAPPTLRFRCVEKIDAQFARTLHQIDPVRVGHAFFAQAVTTHTDFRNTSARSAQAAIMHDGSQFDSKGKLCPRNFSIEGSLSLQNWYRTLFAQRAQSAMNAELPDERR